MFKEHGKTSPNEVQLQFLMEKKMINLYSNP